MTKDYDDENKDFGAEFYEDPMQTPQSHWRWVLPVLFMLVVPAIAIEEFHETSRNSREPLQNSMLNGLPTTGEAGAVGTAGRDRSVAESMVSYSIHEVETITGLVDRRPLIGRKVELHVPVLDMANDQAFWIGERDNRILVVPSRDHRDRAERQAGFVASNSVAPLEVGKTAAISGTIQPIPMAEGTYSWGLTTADREELAARGVYLRADSISVQ
jgi:hypothetical protein